MVSSTSGLSTQRRVERQRKPQRGRLIMRTRLRGFLCTLGRLVGCLFGHDWRPVVMPIQSEFHSQQCRSCTRCEAFQVLIKSGVSDEVVWMRRANDVLTVSGGRKETMTKPETKSSPPEYGAATGLAPVKTLKWHVCPKCGTENFFVGIEHASCSNCDWEYFGNCYVEPNATGESRGIARTSPPVCSVED